MVTKETAWTKVEGILIRIGANEKSIDEIKININNNYVTKDQHEPVKRIIYGLVTVVLLTILGALLKMVIVG